MKTKLLGTTLLISSFAFAAPTPLKTDVDLINSKFSEKIYKALEKNVTPVHTGTHRSADTFLTVREMLSCRKSVVLNEGVKYSCTLLKSGWRSMGMETYGSGFKQNLTKALFDALSVKVVTDTGIKFKTIQLEVADENGGTERNLLSCTRVGKEAEELGLRDTCEVINGL